VTSDNVLHNWSDAWLLLAIVYANQNGGATLDRIIAAGDAINHAIFTKAEFESGLVRLTRSGFIAEKDGHFVPTERAQLQTKLGHTGGSMHHELNDVAQLLGCPSAIDERPSIDNLRYPGFSVAAYERAIETYQRAAETFV
jgi:hypothetical protein